jgi:hypothetical protein
MTTWGKAARKIETGDGMMEAFIELSPNETLHLLAHQDGVKYFTAWEERIKELTREIQHLKIALSKYGHHIDGCGHGWQCNCGFLDLFREKAK